MSPKHILPIFALLATLQATPFIPCATAQTSASEGGEKLSLDFKDVEIASLIATISELTGKNFIYDETVRGKVTIISPKPISRNEAYQLFLSVLNVKGFTVVPSGGSNKIVSIKNAKEADLPTETAGGKNLLGDIFVTRLIPLQNADATSLVTTVLAPLVPKTSHVAAYGQTNTIIITDTASNIERMMDIIRVLDVPSSLDQILVFPLQYASAEEVAGVCNQVIAQAVTAPQRARARSGTPADGSKEVSKIIPFKQTNTLVVMASSDDLAIIKNIVGELDLKPSKGRSRFNLYYLENADAETLAKTLNEILTGVSAQAKAATGAPGAPKLSPEVVTITADKPTNSLIVNADPENYQVIKEIIGQLDIKRKQVYVEALILELSMDATKKLGASLQGAFGMGDDGAVFGSSNFNKGDTSLGDLQSPDLLSKAISGMMLGGFYKTISVIGPNGDTIKVPALSALIDLSKTDTDINILSAPRLLTSDNEEAEIIVGSNVPIITQRLNSTVNPDTQSVAVERKDVALTLRFTPQVTEGNLVRLNVYQESSDIAASSVGNVNQVGPTLTKRLIRNTVLAEDGKTVVLGGLIGTNAQDTVTKTPFFGDIPGLGWLFKRKTHTEKKTNLLVFITPKIVRNGEDLTKVTDRSKEVLDELQQGESPFFKRLDPLQKAQMIPEQLISEPAPAPAAEK